MKTQEKRTIPTNIENKTKSNMTIKTKKRAKMKGQPQYPNLNRIHKQVKSEGLQGQASQWNDSSQT
jgi:hypothetical protein